MDYLQSVKEASEFIISSIERIPDTAVILGTGLGALADEITQKKIIKYKDIPHFPVSTVLGHAGELIAGYINDKYILAMNGRFHYYEGYNMKEVTFPVRVFSFMGIKTLIVSNACGGMNPEYSAGDLMLIEDHINLMGDNPLLGRNIDEMGPRFPDMSEPYSSRLTSMAEANASRLGINVKKGVYVAVTGPNYETPAELKMLRLLGADAVGMSTVPEVIAARHSGMEVLGISCVTDMALAENLEPLDHEKVVEIANKAKPKFVNLVKSIINDLQ